MFGRFKRAGQEKLIRKALTVEFAKRGLDFASFDPTIQRTMVMAALASGSVQQQIDGFARVAAKIAAQDDLPYELKRDLVVKAYAATGSASGNGTLRETEESEEDLSERELVHERLAKLVVRTGRLEISLSLPNDAEPKRLDLPWSAPAPRAVARSSARPQQQRSAGPRAVARARLLAAIAKARLWLDGLIAGRFTSTAEIALHERCSERSVRITLSLAFLAPLIVKASVEGRLPYGLTASSFSELPMRWEEQLHLAS